MAITLAQLIFSIQTTGGQQAVNQINAAYAAMQRLNAVVAAGNTPNLPNLGAAGAVGNAAANAQQARVRQGVNQLGALATTFLYSLEKVFQKFIDFAKEVLNIQALTGSTRQQAVQLATLFRVAGISEQLTYRDIANLPKTTRIGRPAEALYTLGVKIKPGENGAELFGDIFKALDKLKDGMIKTRVITDLFGVRGVAAMEGFLQMTKAQREQALLLASTFDGRGLDAVRSFGNSVSLLGETFLLKLVFPILQKVLPAIEKAVDIATQFINVLSYVDNLSGGILGIALAFGVVTFAVIALIAALKQMAMWQAIIAALSGNWKAIAAAVAVGAGFGAIDYYMSRNEKKDKTEDNTRRSAEALEDIQHQMIGGGPRANREASAFDRDMYVGRILAKGLG